MHRRAAYAAFAAAIHLACSEPSSGPDAGLSIDAGFSIDAGSIRDAGSHRDAHVDARPPDPDANVTPDAGSTFPVCPVLPPEDGIACAGEPPPEPGLPGCRYGEAPCTTVCRCGRSPEGRAWVCYRPAGPGCDSDCPEEPPPLFESSDCETALQLCAWSYSDPECTQECQCHPGGSWVCDHHCRCPLSAPSHGDACSEIEAGEGGCGYETECRTCSCYAEAAGGPITWHCIDC